MQSHPMARIAAQAGEVILGKNHAIRLALTCLLARGHLLIEDLPGVGKTLLSHVLARSLGLGFHRIQFTSDMLPADVLGVSVYDRQAGAFRFHPGPIFHQMILADEVNRATPKAQSALLEAMEERQVTVEGETRALPQPFFVIATQNPSRHIGAFPLPESQLDRFLMRISLGYPDPASERVLLQGEDRRRIVARLSPCLEEGELLALQERVSRLHVAEALLNYVQALLAFSRDSTLFQAGLSPRAGLGLLACARAHAFLEGRDGVVPEDVQVVLPGVAGHRLKLVAGTDADAGAILLDSVPIP